MTTSSIRRQHEATSIPELVGSVCGAFVAVMNTRAGFVGPMYIQLSGVWHRFYIDAGCLFWAEGHAPEPEDDLLDGDIYVDLGESLHVIDTTVSSIRMADCELLVEFGNGGRLELREAVQDEGTRILEATPAPDVGSR